ncbi:MAG: SH3 domain-containing protein [Spirochaetales bacterium]|nr:SH3 domain-containing protein [Spirochaetales bacterium]
MRKIPFIIINVILSLLILVLTSCGGRAIGWGVLLWTDDPDSGRNGEIFPVLSESEIRGTYIIRLPEGTREIPAYRLRVFPKEQSARDFVSSFQEYTGTFGVSRKHGLNIRNSPDSQADQIYRLRENEIVKIVSRSKEKTLAGNLEGYWYEVLTEGGIAGYTFDKYLSLYEEGEDPFAFNILDDPGLAFIMNNVFRSQMVWEMIQENRLDPNRVFLEQGLFPEPENNRIRMVTEKGEQLFEYESITPKGNRNYRFDGTTLSVEISSESKVRLEYVYEGKNTYASYFLIEDLETHLEEALESEGLKLEELLSSGNEFSSTAYGTISIDENGLFTWSNFDRLVPNIIPEGAPGRGRVSFSLFLSRSLRDSYSGVISFYFSWVSGNKGSHFLYTLTPDGIRMIAVPAKSIDNGIVDSDSNLPIRIFFKRTG